MHNKNLLAHLVVTQALTGDVDIRGIRAIYTDQVSIIAGGNTSVANMHTVVIKNPSEFFTPAIYFVQNLEIKISGYFPESSCSLVGEIEEYLVITIRYPAATVNTILTRDLIVQLLDEKYNEQS